MKYKRIKVGNNCIITASKNNYYLGLRVKNSKSLRQKILVADCKLTKILYPEKK